MAGQTEKRIFFVEVQVDTKPMFYVTIEATEDEMREQRTVDQLNQHVAEVLTLAITDKATAKALRKIIMSGNFSNMTSSGHWSVAKGQTAIRPIIVV